MERLSPLQAIVITQKKEMTEVFSGFETCNKYQISDPSGAPLYEAEEVGGNSLVRMFLKAARPFEITVRNSVNETILHVSRPWRFFFHEAEIRDVNGKPIGKIKREFSLLRRIYTMYDGVGQETSQLFGPLLKPWTFEIKEQDRLVGKITKKWSGFLKEGFTDADNFACEFPQDWSVEKKALFMGAVFLIDFCHFENTD